MPGRPMQTGNVEGSSPWRALKSLINSVTTSAVGVPDVVAVQVRRRRLGLAEDATVARHQQGQRLGSADVNADRDVDHRCCSACAFSSRSAWVWMR